eukprot:gene7352-15007_t
MVVIVKKSYTKPPTAYEFEKAVKDLTIHDVRGYGQQTQIIDSPNISPPPLYPIAWGWNSNGRAGNITMTEIREPRQVQKTIKHRFIGSASGMHHSLLLSEDGNVYSFGDGHKSQLGLGNPITFRPKKGGITQVYPIQINPSGYSYNMRDYKISQIACGNTFSIARELTVDEGVALCPGLLELEHSLKNLKYLYPDSLSIQEAWAAIRQERFKISLSCGGHVLSWGTGDLGELGLSKYLPYTPFPRTIPKLKYISITQIAAGAQHVLAITSSEELYSWGNGGSGRLGHNDCYHRNVPTLVEFLLPYYVKKCAAGDAHSAVITVTRKANNPAQQMNRVATFGRGAFGRLGVGDIHNKLLPVAVTRFFESFAPYDIREVACGGAHTLLLASTAVTVTRANPWGVKTMVVSWGFGLNGQLGTGDTRHSYVPVKTRIPKWEIVTNISAGRSWSVASTVDGGVYTWGKGLRGQLGQRERRFSMAPRKLDSFASFVRLSSGYAHNVCISTSKKNLNAKIMEKIALSENSRGNIGRVGVGGGVGGGGAKVEGGGGGPFVDHMNVNLRDQSVGYFQTYRMYRIKALFMLKQIRHEVCAQYWEQHILHTVWDHFHVGYGRFLESRENTIMAIEENAKKAINTSSNISINSTNRLQPTFALSWRSLCYQQMRLHPSRRVPTSLTARASKNFPLCFQNNNHNYEGRYFDRDVGLYTSRFIKNERTLTLVDYDNHRRRERGVLEEMKKLHAAPRFAGSRVKMAALTDELAKIRTASKQTITNAMIRVYSNDEGGGPLGNIYKGKALKIHKRRRNSVTDPMGMYGRICDMRSHIVFQGFMKRRNSLPTNITALRFDAKPTFTYIESIQKSLEVYHTRHTVLAQFVDPEYSYIWLEYSDRIRRRKMIKGLKYSWLTPRLPRETLQRILQPFRRNTISEPERMARQLVVMYKTRTDFALLRKMAREDERMPLRQRSYDPGEMYDHEDGVTERLRLSYEEPLSVPTLMEIQNTHVRIEKMLVSKDFYLEFLANNKSSSSVFSAVRRAPPPPPKDLPPGFVSLWEEHRSDEGHVYYYNPRSGESSWDRPVGTAVQVLQSCQDLDSGAWYWYNSTTGETTWM